MKKIIDHVIKDRDWRGQAFHYGDEQIKISTLISRIESGYWKSKKVKLHLSSIDLSSYDLGIKDMFDFLLHNQLVSNANLEYPIIIDHKGCVIDGRHRICKAIINGDKTIKGIKILDDIY